MDMDPEDLAILKRQGWIGFAIIIGSLLPYTGAEQSLLWQLLVP